MTQTFKGEGFLTVCMKNAIFWGTLQSGLEEKQNALGVHVVVVVVQ